MTLTMDGSPRQAGEPKGLLRLCGQSSTTCEQFQVRRLLSLGEVEKWTCPHPGLSVLMERAYCTSVP